MRSGRGRVIAWGAVGIATIAVGAWFLAPTGEGDAESKGPKRAPHAVAVSAAAVVVGPLVERATWPGELAADVADVPSLVVGRLASVAVRIGDQVGAGDVLAVVDTLELSAQLAAARASVAAANATARRARVELATARRELVRAESMAGDGILSAQALEARRAEVDGARASLGVAEAQGGAAAASADVLERRLAESTIVAPFSGTVADRFVDPGAFVAAGTPVVRVVAGGPLRVTFEVPTDAVGQLKVAGRFAARTAATGGQTVGGTLTGIAGQVSRERRVVKAEGVLEAAPASWLPGMFAEVILPSRSAEQAPIVPAEALLERVDDRGQPARGVFVVDGATARWVPATVLARDGRRVALDATLAAGAQVLVGGHSDLSDGAAIEVADDDDLGGEPAPPAPAERAP